MMSIPAANARSVRKCSCACCKLQAVLASTLAAQNDELLLDPDNPWLSLGHIDGENMNTVCTFPQKC